MYFCIWIETCLFPKDIEIKEALCASQSRERRKFKAFSERRHSGSHAYCVGCYFIFSEKRFSYDLRLRTWHRQRHASHFDDATSTAQDGLIYNVEIMKTCEIISIQKLLCGKNAEFDSTATKDIRLIRHKDKRFSLYDMYMNEPEKFLEYQSEQEKKAFMNVKYIVTFIGEEGTESRFVGIYKNWGIVKDTGLYNGKQLAVFDFREAEGFEALKEKIIIDWNSPISWCQHFENEMPVIRIEKGLKRGNVPFFTRFEDVMLNYNQLAEIFSTDDKDWKARLGSCNGIYLILDKSNGRQYVGSTYNTNGIWGRWKIYAQTGHGGDTKLKELLGKDPDYAKRNFQWSILETLPLRILPEHAIERETLYKRKFGTREHGYNEN